MSDTLEKGWLDRRLEIDSRKAASMPDYMGGQMETCNACGGNDYNVPCAYPSEGMKGCLRDKRIKAGEALPDQVELAALQVRCEQQEQSLDELKQRVSGLRLRYDTLVFAVKEWRDATRKMETALMRDESPDTAMSVLGANVVAAEDRILNLLEGEGK